MGTNDRRKISQLNKELTILTHKMELIKARYIKEIWLDEKYNKEKLRQAELTLRLNQDAEYPTLLEEFWDIEAKREELIDLTFDDILPSD